MRSGLRCPAALSLESIGTKQSKARRSTVSRTHGHAAEIWQPETPPRHRCAWRVGTVKVVGALHFDWRIELCTDRHIDRARLWAQDGTLDKYWAPSCHVSMAIASAKTTSQNVYAQDGTLDKYGVELLGAKLPSINRAEDRNLFKEAMARIGLKTPQSGIANNIEEALKVGTGFGAHRAAAALGQLCSAEDV